MKFVFIQSMLIVNQSCQFYHQINIFFDSFLCKQKDKVFYSYIELAKQNQTRKHYITFHSNFSLQIKLTNIVYIGNYEVKHILNA